MLFALIGRARDSKLDECRSDRAKQCLASANYNVYSKLSQEFVSYLELRGQEAQPPKCGVFYKNCGSWELCFKT